MSLTVRDPRGEVVQLANEPLASGGEAAIYPVPQYPSVLVKRYHDHVTQKRGALLQEKIEAMANDPALAHFKHAKVGEKSISLSWPRFSVFDESGRWIGYAMRRGTGVPMTRLAHAMAYRKDFPGLDRPKLLNYIIALLETVQTLHEAKVYVGDYNPANFLCDPASSTVTFIDSDSWQVTACGKTFPCPVTVPDMLPPELLGKPLETVARTIESERFSLAILLFKMLMLGRHPFDIVGGESPVENIRRGYFPYGKGRKGTPKGPWYIIWSHISYDLKEQFIRTFTVGCANPAERTHVKEWLRLFKQYHYHMTKKGWFSAEMIPKEPKSSEHKGPLANSTDIPISAPNT